MTNWGKIISLAQAGEQASAEAMSLIYKDIICQKRAYLMFKNYEKALPKTAKWVQWEDVLKDACFRFVQAVHKGTDIKNGEAVFVQICKNYCRELARQKPNDPINKPVNADTMDGLKDNEFLIEDDYSKWCKSKLLHYVSLLPTTCQKLIRILYFNNPPEENMEVIAKALDIDQKSLLPMAWACRKKLKELIGSNLDDCQDTLFNQGIH